jgi:putative GTP pyrophosphokinase
MSRGGVISKSQADRLGDELRHGEITAELIERLSAYREHLVLGATGASETIRSLTEHAVTPREGKSTGSIVAKLHRQPIALSRMQDIVGCRIVVNTITDQDDLTQRIVTRFPDARLMDRRLKPSFGYRAVHVIVRWNDSPYEVQVRTRLQHAWAEVVERLSDRAAPDLKYGKGNGSLLVYVTALSKTIASIEAAEREIATTAVPVDEALAARLSRLREGVLQTLNIAYPIELP